MNFQFESVLQVYGSMTYNNSAAEICISSPNFYISSKNALSTIADLLKSSTFAPGY